MPKKIQLRYECHCFYNHLNYTKKLQNYFELHNFVVLFVLLFKHKQQIKELFLLKLCCSRRDINKLYNIIKLHFYNMYIHW